MDSILAFFHSAPFFVLPIFFVFSLFVLGRSAELIVDVAVILSLKLKISGLIIGATVISLGTTLPEVCVSVLASLQGKGDMALGNAVGSIICDTALILGLVSVLGRIPIDKSLTSKQGWVQFFFGFLLVVASLSGWSYTESARTGGHLPQSFGFLALFLLGVYLCYSIYSAKKADSQKEAHIEFDESLSKLSLSGVSIRLLGACLLLAVSSEVLILSASEVALRINVPQSVIAVTFVALGTSVPELVTSFIAVKKGFGEIALGNIIGADILNVLLVAGGSVLFAKDGFFVDPVFFTRSFPVMIAALFILRLGLSFSGLYLHKGVGLALVCLYAYFTGLNIQDFF